MHPSTELTTLARQHYQHCLDGDLRRRKDLARQLGPDDDFASALGCEATLNRLQRQLALCDTVEIAPFAERLLVAGGLATDPRTLEQASLALLRAEAEAARRGIERNAANYYGAPTDPLFAELPAPPAAAPMPAAGGLTTPSPIAAPASRPAGLGVKADHTVSEICEEALREKELPEKTQDKYRVAARTFTATIGEKPIWQYQRSDIVAYKDALVKAPQQAWTNFGTNNLAEAAASNARLSRAKPVLSATTVNDGYLTYIKQIFAHAYDNAAVTENIAVGVRVATGGKGKSLNKSKKRFPFSANELATLFGSPLFLGSDPDDLLTSGSILDKSWQFWLPLLMAFTGARPNELGQLRPADLISRHGWPCLIITTEADPEDEDESERGCKTAAGEREIPLHPQLIRLGFLELVAERRHTGDVRLFPDWVIGHDGTYSDTSSRRFNRRPHYGLLRRLGLDRKRTTLYSLRHNFANALTHSEFLEAEHNAVMGHSNGGTREIYGSREAYARLINKMIRLDLQGVDYAAIPPRYRLGSESCSLLARAAKLTNKTNLSDISGETDHGQAA